MARALGVDDAAYVECLHELGWTERDYDHGQLEKTTNFTIDKQQQQQADLLITQHYLS